MPFCVSFYVSCVHVVQLIFDDHCMLATDCFQHAVMEVIFKLWDKMVVLYFTEQLLEVSRTAVYS